MTDLKRTVRRNRWGGRFHNWFLEWRRALTSIATAYLGISAFIYNFAPEDALGRYIAIHGSIVFLKDAAILFMTAIGLQIGGQGIREAFHIELRPWFAQYASKHPTLYVAFDINIAMVYASLLIMAGLNCVYAIEPWLWVHDHLQDLIRSDVCHRITGGEVGPLVPALRSLCGG